MYSLNSKEEISWKPNSRSVGQKILCPLRKPKFNYRFQSSPPLGPILNHINLVHILIMYIFKIHYNIIFPFMSRSPKWLSSLQDFRNNILYASLSPPMRFRSSHLYLITLKIFGQKYKLWSPLYAVLFDPTALPPSKNRRYPLDRGLCWPQRSSVCIVTTLPAGRLRCDSRQGLRLFPHRF
jgi:hypothetical protein